VLVYKDRIIGEGWHRLAGQPHAEVNAINSVAEKHLLKTSCIYVSLEPCSHFGKTPPCSDLIIASGIKKVVIGTVDPFAKVAGRGIQKLLAAGCEVIVGILEAECRELNHRFFTFHEQKRPYIILKWAQTNDRFIAPEARDNREPVWITNSVSRQLVHKWRAEEQGILVGTNTAIEDDPKLDTRLWDGPNPVRIVLDQNLRIPHSSALFNGVSKTMVFHGKGIDPKAKHDESKNLQFIPLTFDANIINRICEVLYKEKIQSLIVEGGSKTLTSFIEKGIWDEARIFTGTNQFKKGVAAPHFSGKLISETRIASDNLKIFRND